MFYLIAAICCYTALVFIFKVFEQYKIQLFEAIVVNYFVCIVTGILFLPENQNFYIAEIPKQPWFLAALWIGFSFLGCFILIGKSIQTNGLTVTTVATRTSMALPVIMAVWLYGDTLNALKITGILLAIIAVYLTSKQTNTDNETKDIQNTIPKWVKILPVIVFLWNGLIEISFNYAQQRLIPATEEALFVISIFAIAFLIGAVTLVFKATQKKLSLTRRDIIAGVIMGIPNYFSAYYYLLALTKSQWQSSVVIPVNGIGIVLLSAAGATILFKEQLNNNKIAGIICATAAIICLVIGK